ncbi:Branched-chain amino acid transport protein AzlD [Butyrivibrio sp. INlla18]|uniref:branched-chain amino acid transporter permease n=1 Tax=Butyrivibrio sp. INlla18 TaxID=1520806 RepID=UPI00088A6F6D|nr:AzlD domain-containing protein [Butyrivibrio sp. INlla18]SDA63236.1 Branched-chain amino acid transport protein AzlD [Butyrivibrio sp. INlla18]
MALILIALMAVTTMTLRFLPFLIFGENTPRYITYLGKVLPQATIGFLVIYCLKDVSFTSGSYGIPEVVAVVMVAGMQAWKRNTVLSILLGTVVYMFLIRIII